MARILVTGGAGYIGSKFCLKNSEDHHITVIDREFPNKLKNRYEKEDIDIVNLDLSNKYSLNKYLKGYDVIIHLAVMHEAKDGVDKPNCSSSFDTLLQNNVSNFKKLTDAFLNSDTDQLINISSYYVYPKNTAVVNERIKPQPNHIRGLIKRTNEHLANIAEKESEKNISTLRLPIVSGTSPNMRWEPVPNKFVRNSVIKKPLVLEDGGAQFHNFINIKDAIRGIEKAIGKNKIKGEIINLSGNDTITILELAEIVEETAEEYGIPVKKLREPEQGRQYVEPTWDTKKAQKLLGYTPNSSIKEAIDEMFVLAYKRFN